jgi:hypothetical protein
MCILEKTSYIYKENLDIYPYFCRGLVPKVNGALVVKEEGAVENGDTVVIDFEGFVDGEAFEGGTAENYTLEILGYIHFRCISS